MLEGDESSGKEQRGEPGWGPGRGEACPSRCLHRERIRGGAAKRPTPVPEKCSCLFARLAAAVPGSESTSRDKEKIAKC